MFGGGMNPRKMQQMMEQMGIDMTELDAEEVVIRTPDEELVFTDADVTRMDAQGTETYQIAGEPETRGRDDAAGADDADEDTIPDEDVELVVARTGASEEAAHEALAAEDGDLAAAVSRLE
ncbi:MAG: nascent polypeptide associated complex NAC [uncultured archaeon A07HB70]|nr:MAG: nascent polypeptide associated complex NAC [uncultured archaeon A07HB70]